jgi:hypothetical protein
MDWRESGKFRFLLTAPYSKPEFTHEDIGTIDSGLNSVVLEPTEEGGKARSLTWAAMMCVVTSSLDLAN